MGSCSVVRSGTMPDLGFSAVDLRIKQWMAATVCLILIYLLDNSGSQNSGKLWDMTFQIIHLLLSLCAVYEQNWS